MRDHKYGDPINKIHIIRSRNVAKSLIASCDKHCVKLWDKETSELFTTVETEKNINDFLIYPNSGKKLLKHDIIQV